MYLDTLSRHKSLPRSGSVSQAKHSRPHAAGPRDSKLWPDQAHFAVQGLDQLRACSLLLLDFLALT